MKTAKKRTSRVKRLVGTVAFLCLLAGTAFGLGNYQTNWLVDTTAFLDVNPSANAQVEVTGGKAYIGKARAKEIALEKAGVSADSLIAYEMKMDFDHGIMIYDAEFISGGYEYDYEINAVTGAVIMAEKEYRGIFAPSAPAPVQNHGKKQSEAQPVTMITPEKAKEIALLHAGVESEDVVGYTSKPDRDDGVIIYEIEFFAGGYEYDYEINAVTGAVMEFDKDRR